MTLQLHRPDGEGGLEPVPPAEADWRTQLQSPRWGTSLEGDRLPELANPEMNPTSRFRSVLFWLSLAVVTFVILVLGYGVGFWRLSTTEQPSPSASPAAVVMLERSYALRGADTGSATGRALPRARTFERPPLYFTGYAFLLPIRRLQ